MSIAPTFEPWVNVCEFLTRGFVSRELNRIMLSFLLVAFLQHAQQSTTSKMGANSTQKVSPQATYE